MLEDFVDVCAISPLQVLTVIDYILRIPTGLDNRQPAVFYTRFCRILYKVYHFLASGIAGLALAVVAVIYHEAARHPQPVETLAPHTATGQRRILVPSNPLLPLLRRVASVPDVIAVIAPALL